MCKTAKAISPQVPLILENGLRTVGVVFAVEQSAREGRVIDVNL
jgi:hypothetical protein